MNFKALALTALASLSLAAPAAVEANDLRGRYSSQESNRQSKVQECLMAWEKAQWGYNGQNWRFIVDNSDNVFKVSYGYKRGGNGCQTIYKGKVGEVKTFKAERIQYALEGGCLVEYSQSIRPNSTGKIVKTEMSCRRRR